MSKKHSMTLKIVFDTDVLFSGTAYNLINMPTIELIEKFGSIDELEILWFMPETVLNERRYQMRKKAKELFPAIEKLERLLGHNLNITESIVNGRIDEAINKQIDKYNLNIIQLDTSKVDWNNIMERASYRIEPFENGEKEKGFRDAMIWQSFLQLIAISPKTPSVCRLILVTGDERLSMATNNETNKLNNVYIVESIEQLLEYINTMISTVTIEFVEAQKVIASKYFYDSESKNGLLVKEGILEQIMSKFADKVDIVPENAIRKEEGRWVIIPPTFIKKKNHRIFWKSLIIRSVIYDVDKPRPNYFSIVNPSIGNIGQNEFINKICNIGAQKKLWNQLLIQEPIILDTPLKAIAKFEVQWSITLSTNMILSRPKIEDIVHVE